MQYSVTPVTAFAQNCSIVWCPTTRQCAFIDPGGDVEQLLAKVQQQGLQPVSIFLTHGHLDHVGGAAALARHYRIPINGPHVADRYWLDALPWQAQTFGLPDCAPLQPDRWLEEGDTLTVGGESLTVLHTPGHTPGHVVFWHAASRTVFVGDVLFYGSVGRSDFPGGDAAQLLASIQQKLLPLGDDVTVVPGHGRSTTIGRERLHNPYVSVSPKSTGG